MVRMVERQERMMEGQVRVMEGQERVMEGQMRVMEGQERVMEGKVKVIYVVILVKFRDLDLIWCDPEAHESSKVLQSSSKPPSNDINSLMKSCCLF